MGGKSPIEHFSEWDGSTDNQKNIKLAGLCLQAALKNPDAPSRKLGNTTNLDPWNQRGSYVQGYFPNSTTPVHVHQRRLNTRQLQFSANISTW